MKTTLCIPILIMLLTIAPIVSSTTMIDYDYTSDLNKQLLAPNVLTLTYKGEEKQYSLENLQGFDSITGNGGRLKVTGSISGPYEYTGVLITTLADEFSSMSSEYSVVAIADDGYTVSYTSDEVQGNIMVYDSEGNEVGIGGVSMVLATMEGGETDYPGSYRIVFVNEDDPITDSFLWAKYLVELEFIDESNDDTPPAITMVKPSNGVYLFDRPLIPYPKPFIIGEITIEINAYDDSGISRVLFVVNEELKHELTSAPYYWLWDETAIGEYTIETIAYDNAGNIGRAQKSVFIINP